MKVFIYLIGRDRRDLKIITTLSGSCPAKRIKDIKELNLSHQLEQQVQEIIYENRMDYEAWVESAESEQDLVELLTGRGHKQFPMTFKHLIKDGGHEKLDPLISKKMKL